jgi:hypothetical protein
MRDLLIVILTAAVILLLWMQFNGHPEVVRVKVKTHQDSIVVAKKEIRKIRSRESALIELHRKDSASDLKTRKLYESKIRKLRARADKVTEDIAVAPDSTKEPLYIDIVGIKDSLISIQEARIDTLQNYQVRLVGMYEDRLQLKDDAFKAQKEISDHFEKIGQHYRKSSRRERRMSWLKIAGAGLIGYGVGKL